MTDELSTWICTLHVKSISGWQMSCLLEYVQCMLRVSVDDR